jgi:hypothetical protein
LTIRAGNGTHSAATPCVTIKNSLVNGVVDNSYYGKGYGPLLLSDVEISPPQGTTLPGLSEANWFGYRLNVHGGSRGAVQCDGDCELHDSFLHDYYFQDTVHFDAVESSGNDGNRILIDHNTLLCSFVNPAAKTSNGGCAADVGFYGDFSPISNIAMVNNLLKANPQDEYFCVHTGAQQAGKPFPIGSNLTWSNNTFERGSSGKCGAAGPVADWAKNSGNVWTRNVWDDGAPLNP